MTHSVFSWKAAYLFLEQPHHRAVLNSAHAGFTQVLEVRRPADASAVMFVWDGTDGKPYASRCARFSRWIRQRCSTCRHCPWQMQSSCGVARISMPHQLLANAIPPAVRSMSTRLEGLSADVPTARHCMGVTVRTSHRMMSSLQSSRPHDLLVM